MQCNAMPRLVSLGSGLCISRKINGNWEIEMPASIIYFLISKQTIARHWTRVETATKGVVFHWKQRNNIQHFGVALTPFSLLITFSKTAFRRQYSSRATNYQPAYTTWCRESFRLPHTCTKKKHSSSSIVSTVRPLTMTITTMKETKYIAYVAVHWQMQKQ